MSKRQHLNEISFKSIELLSLEQVFVLRVAKLVNVVKMRRNEEEEDDMDE
jgi:hypothetical protein